MDPEKKEDEEEIVTLNEFLQEEEAADNEISCVISASDPKNCSYDEGYVARQAVFVCQTCVRKDDETKSQSGGVCLACSLQCHDGHEQLVLYTKRRFRCDCGNAKFPDFAQCRLRNKKEVNDKNVYGQNFQGLYCTCHRPYPDPEDDVEDEMVQCCVCEDWFHCRHLQPPLELSDDHYELICQLCTARHPFLRNLADMEDKKDTTEGQTSEAANEDQSPPCKRQRHSPFCLSSGAHEGESRCIVITDDGWRGKLCRCESCKKLLTDSGLLFLLDEDDSVGRYEAKGREKKQEVESTTELKVAELWNNMGRIRQVEVGSRLYSFRSQLQDFLAEYHKDGKVVTKEAVGEFFQSLIAQDPGPGVVNSCSFKL